jgi:uncharacterized membrane protein
VDKVVSISGSDAALRSTRTLGHMTAAEAFQMATLGLFAAVTFFSLSVGWCRRLLSALGKLPPQSGGAAASKASKFGVSLTLIHPAPWILLLGIPYGFMHFYRQQYWSEWLWFIGAAMFTLAAFALLAALIMRRNRRRAAAAAQVAASGDEHVA